MAVKLHLTVDAAACFVTVVGDLNEGSEAPLAELGKGLTRRPVTFDLRALRSLNSVGCGAWARAMAGIATKHLVELVNCPVAFIDYCNLIPAMLGDQGLGVSVLIRTFYAPYYCQVCNLQTLSLLRLADVEATRCLPDFPCQRCGTSLPPEAQSEDYLQFLARTI